MKNKLLLSGILIALTVLPIVSSAESDTSTEARLKAKAEFEERKQELESKKESIKNSIAERRENAIDKIKNRLDKFIEKINERFDAAVERLGKLADRIDSRINKLEAEKLDVSKAKTLMVAAKAKIEIAKSSVADLSFSASTTATTTSSIKKDFAIIRTKIEAAKRAIKAAHAALVDVIKNLKPGQLRGEGKASSTVETED